MSFQMFEMKVASNYESIMMVKLCIRLTEKNMSLKLEKFQPIPKNSPYEKMLNYL